MAKTGKYAAEVVTVPEGEDTHRSIDRIMHGDATMKLNTVGVAQTVHRSLLHEAGYRVNVVITQAWALDSVCCALGVGFRVLCP